MTTVGTASAGGSGTSRLTTLCALARSAADEDILERRIVTVQVIDVDGSYRMWL